MKNEEIYKKCFTETMKDGNASKEDFLRFEDMWKTDIEFKSALILFAKKIEEKARQDEQRRIVDTLNELSTWCLSEDTPDFWEINDVLRVIETPEIHKAMMEEKVKTNEK